MCACFSLCASIYFVRVVCACACMYACVRMNRLVNTMVWWCWCSFIFLCRYARCVRCMNLQLCIKSRYLSHTHGSRTFSYGGTSELTSDYFVYLVGCQPHNITLDLCWLAASLVSKCRRLVLHNSGLCTIFRLLILCMYMYVCMCVSLTHSSCTTCTTTLIVMCSLESLHVIILLILSQVFSLQLSWLPLLLTMKVRLVFVCLSVCLFVCLS